MRILLVTDTFPPDINGVARTLQKWVEGLRERGHTVGLVTTLQAGGGQPDDREVVGSVPLPGYPGLRIGLASRRQMKALIHGFGAEVLYVATETPLGLAAIQAARKLKIPVISGFHTNFQTYLENYSLPGFEMVARWLLRFLHNRTARTLTPSEDTAATLRSWGVREVGVLGRGVDTEAFNPKHRDPALRSSWGASEQSPVALYVGRIAPEKNLPLVAKTFSEMRRILPQMVGVIVGDGPLAKSFEIDHPEWVFAGSRTGMDLARHYASADLFVFPSMTETFGNVVLEAMASGLATVAFDYAAPRLLIRHGENGWLTPFGDEKNFLLQAGEALNHWTDEVLRAKARETSLSHSWERVIDQFEQELLSVVSVVQRGGQL